MTHFIVGDGHYTGERDQVVRWRRLLARAKEAGVTELSILGDFFELWLGLAGLEQAWQHAFLEPLAQLKSEGVTLRYVVGNKDYFIAEWNRRHGLFDHVVDPSVTLPSAHGALHLAHGDLVNHADRQYRLWRAVSRSVPVRATARVLPRSWLRRLSAQLSQTLRGTNRTHKSYFPETQLRARAHELPPGPGLVIYGHFHVHRELHEAAKHIITLPFLGGENAGILLRQDRIEKLAA